MTHEKSTPFGRSAALEAAIAAASDPLEVTIGLPEIVDGDLDFTFLQAWPEVEEPQAWDIAFRWDGYSSRVVFRLDISEHEDQSPASSAPIFGWASWQVAPGLLVAFSCPDLEWDGWVRVPDGSPVADGDEDELADPARWVNLAKTINLAIIGLDQGQMEGGSFRSEA